MDLFISYARATSKQARFFAEAFRSLGYDVWMDETLPGHRPYADVIREKLEASRAVLVIWSADAAVSEWVRSEADFARKGNKLIQLSIDATPLPMPFDQIHCVEMSNLSLDSTGWQTLLDSVAILAGNTESAGKDLSKPKSYEIPRKSKTPWNWLALALGSLLISGAATWRWSTQPDAELTTETVPADIVVAKGNSFDDRAIVLLPFDNLSTDPEQAYFAAGLTDDLTKQLTAWSVPVIRTSRDRYSSELTPREIAVDLSARTVVYGSVRRGGDRIRVTVSVVDAKSGVTRYNGTFDREVADFFDMQAEMSARIGASLLGDLALAAQKRATQESNRTLDAWSLYTLGMQAAITFDADNSEKAGEYFKRALELDPDFAEAKAMLGFGQAWQVVTGVSTDPEADLKGSVLTIREALRLSPRNAFIYTQLAFPLLTLGDVKAAGEALRHAEELGGPTPMLLVQLAMLKIMENDPEGAIEASLKAIRLDPHGPNVESYYDNIAIAAFESEQYEMGLDAARRTIAVSPKFHSGYWTAAVNLVGLGRVEEAKAVIDEARSNVHGISIAMIQQAFNHERPEADAKRNKALRTAGLD